MSGPGSKARVRAAGLKEEAVAIEESEEEVGGSGAWRLNDWHHQAPANDNRVTADHYPLSAEEMVRFRQLLRPLYDGTLMWPDQRHLLRVGEEMLDAYCRMVRIQVYERFGHAEKVRAWFDQFAARSKLRIAD